MVNKNYASNRENPGWASKNRARCHPYPWLPLSRQKSPLTQGIYSGAQSKFKKVKFCWFWILHLKIIQNPQNYSESFSHYCSHGPWIFMKEDGGRSSIGQSSSLKVKDYANFTKTKAQKERDECSSRNAPLFGGKPWGPKTSTNKKERNDFRFHFISSLHFFILFFYFQIFLKPILLILYFFFSPIF